MTNTEIKVVSNSTFERWAVMEALRNSGLKVIGVRRLQLDPDFGLVEDIYTVMPTRKLRKKVPEDHAKTIVEKMESLLCKGGE